MITLITNAIAFIAVLLAFTSGSSPLLLICIGLLFALLIARDIQNRYLNQRLYSVYSKLQSLNRERRRKGNSEMRPNLIVDKLDQKIESLVSEVDDLRRQASFRAELPLTSLKPSNAPIERQHFISQLANFLKDRLKAQLVMVQVCEGSGSDHTVFSGLESERARSLVQDWVKPFTFSNDSSHCGIHIIPRDKGRLSGLSHFGLTQLLCHTINLEIKGDRPSSLTFCVAYTGGQRQLEQELAILQRIAVQATKDLPAYNPDKVTPLSDETDKGEHTLIEQDHLAHISHDLRSPLNNIKAILSLLRLQEKEAANLDLVSSAIGNCSHLEELVEGILDYTQFKAGKLVARSEVFDITLCIQELIENFKIPAQVKHIALSLESAQSFYTYADKRQVRRILSNIISNALKYTNKGSVKLSIAQTMAGRVVVSVSDTGVGMDQEQLARLFTPFTRFNASDQEGVGLGLAVSRILAEKNEGSLKAESKKGQGSVFLLNLPKALAATPVAQPAKRRILLLDDDIECLRTLARLLQTDNRELVLCHSEERAVAHIQNERIDLVISDHQMPQGGASYLFEQVQNLPPVIILTGETNPERLKQLKAMGACDILIKPVEPDELSRSLEENMESTKAKQSLVA